MRNLEDIHAKQKFPNHIKIHIKILNTNILINRSLSTNFVIKNIMTFKRVADVIRVQGIDLLATTKNKKPGVICYV